MENIINDDKQMNLLLKDWFDLACFSSTSNLNITVKDFKKLNDKLNYDCRISVFASWFIWLYYLMLYQDNFKSKEKLLNVWKLFLKRVEVMFFYMQKVGI